MWVVVIIITIISIIIIPIILIKTIETMLITTLMMMAIFYILYKPVLSFMMMKTINIIIDLIPPSLGDQDSHAVSLFVDDLVEFDKYCIRLQEPNIYSDTEASALSNPNMSRWIFDL